MGFPFVDAIQGIFTEAVVGFLKRHVRFLMDYKKNMKNLADEKKNLEDQRKIIDENIEEANDQGRVIEDKVSKWKENMEVEKNEVEKLLQIKTGKENFKCFTFSCPNYFSRYQLSKQAQQRTGEVQKLVSEGSNFSEVSRPRPPPPELQFPSSIAKYKDFGSRVAVLKEIKKAMKENDIVGIYGTGGVGKTTMAAEIGKQLQNEGYFYEVVIAVVSKDVNIRKIQAQIAAGLKNFTMDKGTEEIVRAKELWNRLKNGKRNLVILDDLWGKLNPKDIGIPVGDGSIGCKLLLTSRSPDVWKNMSVDEHTPVREFHIRELEDSEAWTLFKNHAGDQIESPGLHHIASQVCKRCGGLPVAIRAVGEALRDKDIRGWRDALRQLEKSTMESIVGIDLEILKSLKLSYNALSSNEAQKCFLLCCLFPDDTVIPVEDLVVHCKAARLVEIGTMEETRDRVCVLINHLKARCLLLDVKSYKGDCVMVHDVIRDVGISVSKEDKSYRIMHGLQDIQGRGEDSLSSEWKDKRRPYIAMSLQANDFAQKFQLDDEVDDFGVPEVGTLLLKWNNSSTEEVYSRAKRFLSKTSRSLKVLVMYEASISSLFLSIPSSSSGEILVNLRMLSLNTWKECDKSMLKYSAKTLEVLCLSDGEVVELPVEIGLLTQLLVLDLECLWKLERIPYGILSKLTRLEELRLPRDFVGWASTSEDERGRSEKARVDELHCLKQLTTLRTCLPDCDMPWADDRFFDKLERFHISVGAEITTLSCQFSKVLEFTGVPTKNQLYGLKGKAEVLHFERVDGLNAVINGTTQGFPYLKVLKIAKCDDLKYLLSPLCARALCQQLEEITVVNCKSLVSIVGGTEEDILERDQEDIVCFDRLKYLALENVPKLVGFYSKGTENHRERSILFSGKIACPSLKSLAVIGAPMITEIWDQRSVKGFLQSLTDLRIQECEHLEAVVSDKRSEDQEQIADSDVVLVFPRLRNINLHGGLNNLKSFYCNGLFVQGKPIFDTQIACPSLEELAIANAPMITAIWDQQSVKGFLQNLTFMYIAKCEHLEVVVSEKRKEDQQQIADGDVALVFPRLRNIFLEGGLNNLKSFYCNEFFVQGNPFFNGQIACPSLESLEIRGAPMITVIWDQQSVKGFLQSLTQLTIYECEHLEAVVSDKRKEDQQQIADGDAVLVFPHLRNIFLYGGLNNLKSFNCNRFFVEGEQPFFNIQVKCPVLEKLFIWEVPKIENIWDQQSYKNFPNLETLWVSNCKKIESIVSNQGKEGLERTIGDIIVFPHLTNLQLRGIINLRQFYAMRSLPEEESFFNHQIVYPALEMCVIYGISEATEVFNTRILPQLIGQMCQQENNSQRVLLPRLWALDLRDECTNWPLLTSFTPAEHRFTATINGKACENCDKSLFQPLFNAILGFGSE